MQAPNYPDAGRSWNIVDKYKVSIFYTAPTLVRSLMRDGDEVRNLYAYSMLSWKIICDGEQKVPHMENFETTMLQFQRSELLLYFSSMRFS